MGATEGPFLVLTEHGKALAAAAKAKRLARQAAFAGAKQRGLDRLKARAETLRANEDETPTPGNLDLRARKDHDAHAYAHPPDAHRVSPT